MDSARCTQNSAIYNAQQFAGLAADELAQKRQNLVCPACGRPAFFRKETQNDRDPCFGARPHADGCQLSAAQAAAKACDRTDALADLLNPNNRIVIDFRYGTPEQANQPIHCDGNQSTQEPDHPAAPAGWATHTVTHMRLHPLLRLLVTTPQFWSSQKVIHLGGVGSFRACDFFVPFNTITAQNEGMFIAVFGRIVSAQYLPQYDAVWLNSGRFNEPSIWVPCWLAAILLDRFQINDIGKFTHSNLLVMGTVQVSQQGKNYIMLENPHQFMVDFGREQ